LKTQRLIYDGGKRIEHQVVSQLARHELSYQNGKGN